MLMFSAIGEVLLWNLFLKFIHITSFSRVCICCCIPIHQYSTSVTNRKVANVSFLAFVHSITQKIFSHSRSHVSASSGVALLVNFAGVWSMKSSIVTGLTGGIIILSCATTGCIASTILWIAFAISLAPTLFLRLRLAIVCACHII